MFLNYRDHVLHLLRMLLGQVTDLDAAAGMVWNPVTSAVFFSLALLPLAVWLYRRPANLFHYNPAQHAPEWRGLRGLLIPLLIMVCAEIPRAGLALWQGDLLLRQDVWSLLIEGAEPFSRPAWAQIVQLHFCSNALRLVFGGLLLATFLVRRRIFRNLLIAYILVDNTLLCARYLAFNSIYESDAFVFIYESFTDWSESTQVAMILIPYLLLSRRVHATFYR